MKDLTILKQIECDYNNVKEMCEKYLSGYKYSYGSSKIVVFIDNDFVVKKIFGRTSVDEVKISEKAQEKGLGNFFALAMLKSDNIYAQEKIDISLSEYVHNLNEKIPYGKLREYYRNIGLEQMLYRSDCCVLYYLLREYSIKEVLRLQEFIVENDLTDLNFYNVGFKNGKIKFFDFSGMDKELEW